MVWKQRIWGEPPGYLQAENDILILMSLYKQAVDWKQRVCEGNHQVIHKQRMPVSH